MSFAVIATNTDDVLGVELETTVGGTEAERAALGVLVTAFDLTEVVDPDEVLSGSTASYLTDGHVLCAEPAEVGVSIRVLLSAMTCER